MAKLHDTSRDKLETRNPPGFLSRWSQRKQESQVADTEGGATSESPVEKPVIDLPSGPAATASVSTSDPDAANLVTTLDRADDYATPAGASELPPDNADPAVAGETQPEEEVLLTDEDMPPLESLQKDSDVSMFFNRGVSRELRKAALRKLFSLPGLNITDGLNDYDEDYTTFEPLGDIVTSDMRFHAERKAGWLKRRKLDSGPKPRLLKPTMLNRIKRMIPGTIRMNLKRHQKNIRTRPSPIVKR